MKKFTFSLKSVGIVRQARELRLREAFSVALRAVVEAEQALARIRREQAEFERGMIAERVRAFRPADQVAFLHAHQILLVRERGAVADVERTVVERELRRTEWLGSRRDLRLIEKLEQTARQEYRIEEDRETQRMLDDRAPSGGGWGSGAAA